MNKDKTTFLEALATIVCDIDENKNSERELVGTHVDRAFALLNQMQLARLDTGMLADIFFSIQVWHAQVKYLPTMIGKAHEEIIRLLGNDAWQFYGLDDDEY
ncbi:MAG: hypothetical protein Q8S46_01045 [Methylotenera sp.]|nr:hypothetical protein [Methylotenera sp.]MDO9233347.1 hypothetical protein [Methylotenera sp.]MDO9389779.1 hypothetical protein [Methylotenera sp.]MDP1595894.1 hypothetical protein [Methylotenera sp.]MDP1755117.1 hypothetical protein [Methylotenera sp.]